MSEAPAPPGICPACGAEAASGSPCQACEPVAVEQPGADACAADRVEEAKVALAMRVGGALIYVAVGAACVYWSIPLFEAGDWWFGIMGIGLAGIAVIGVKQSLFPKEWTRE